VIVAIATAAGAEAGGVTGLRATRAVVRSAGPGAFELARQMLGVEPLHGRSVDARFPIAARNQRHVRGISEGVKTDGESSGSLSVGVKVWAFAAGRSYSGDETVEYHVPGGPVVGRKVLDRLLWMGARMAEAGEFTARAFLNGKLDLTRAEGVALTIAAEGRAQLDAARSLLAGELSRRLKPMMDEVADVLSLVEAGIDFSDEDISFIPHDEVRARIERVLSELVGLLSESARLEQIGRVPRVVLVGRPNAGKSTLLNALVGERRAVVSEMPGTTRDVIASRVKLDRGMVEVCDVAGLDDSAAPDTSSEVSEAMQRQARRAIAEAELVVGVRAFDDVRGLPAIDRGYDLEVLTQIDRRGVAEIVGEIEVSAKSGQGMDLLRGRLDGLAFGPLVSARRAGAVALSVRHVEALVRARIALEQARDQAKHGGPIELQAADLRVALDCLGEVLGAVSPDDVLGRVFSRFCIGK
jgi:tRNA modification GTPase